MNEISINEHEQKATANISAFKPFKCGKQLVRTMTRMCYWMLQGACSLTEDERVDNYQWLRSSKLKVIPLELLKVSTVSVHKIPLKPCLFREFFNSHPLATRPISFQASPKKMLDKF